MCTAGCKKWLLGPSSVLRNFGEINLGLSTNNPQKPTKEWAKCWPQKFGPISPSSSNCLLSWDLCLTPQICLENSAELFLRSLSKTQKTQQGFVLVLMLQNWPQMLGPPPQAENVSCSRCCVCRSTKMLENPPQSPTIQLQIAPALQAPSQATPQVASTKDCAIHGQNDACAPLGIQMVVRWCFLSLQVSHLCQKIDQRVPNNNTTHHSSSSLLQSLRGSLNCILANSDFVLLAYSSFQLQKWVEFASVEWHSWSTEEVGEISPWKPLVVNNTCDSAEPLEQQSVKCQMIKSAEWCYLPLIYNCCSLPSRGPLHQAIWAPSLAIRISPSRGCVFHHGVVPTSHYVINLPFV